MRPIKTKIAVFIICFLFGIASMSGQGMAPDNPPGDPDPGDDPIGGGGAPVGTGVTFFAILGGAYAFGRTFFLKKQE